MNTVDSGQQYGFVFKLANPDYSKCEQGSVRIASIRMQDAKDRKQLERIASKFGAGVRQSEMKNTAKRSHNAKKYEDVLKKLRIYNKLQEALKDTNFVIANFDNWILTVNQTPSYCNIHIELFALDKANRQLYRFSNGFSYRIKEDETIKDSMTIGDLNNDFKLVPTKAKLLHPAGWYSKDSIDQEDLEKQIPPRKVAELLNSVVKKIAIGQIVKLMEV